MNDALPLVTLPYRARARRSAFRDSGFVGSVAADAVLLGDRGFALSATEAVAANRGDPPALNRIIRDIVAATLLLGLISLAVLIVVTAAPPRRRACEALLRLAWRRCRGT